MAHKILVAPSLLSADFTQLSEEIQRMQEAGADWLHVDVMDGHFVPNLTIGPFIVSAIRKASRIPLDVHLMIENPLRHIETFHQAGADSITVHIEACKEEIEKVIEKVKSFKRRAGVAFRPKTPLPEPLKNSCLQKADLILLMTVEPGFGGQAFMPEVLPKIKRLRIHYPGDIQVDGGITDRTAPAVIQAGANVLVSGTYLFQAEDPKTVIWKWKKGGDK